MAGRRKTAALVATEQTANKGAFLRGTVVIEPLSGFKPNAWNPNRMTPAMMRAMVDGLRRDGWLVSQALLVWGTDDRGVARNVIIDGEHRYRAALETGLTEGPVVRLDGITEAQAKALTVKMNQKRGDFDSEMLSELMRGIQYDSSISSGDDFNLATAFGFDDEQLMKLLAEPETIVSPIRKSEDDSLEGDSAGTMSVGGSIPQNANSGLPQSKIRMQQLFFDEETHAEFSQRVRELSAVYGTKNVTDTTLEAIRFAAKSLKVLGAIVISIQLRSRASSDYADKLIGTMAERRQFPILSSHGNLVVFKPNGERLLTVIREAVSENAAARAYPFLHWLRRNKSMNRGAYAGSKGFPVRKSGVVSKTSEATPVRSAIAGSFDRYPRIPFCRETVFSTTKPEEWRECFPMIQEVARAFQANIPDRYEAQTEAAKKTHPAYVIPDTPYTTLTVNNCVAGAYHTDKGDYKPGFGCLVVFRRGVYEGCELGFPRYGIGVDLKDRDLILFDPHEVHGNTPFENCEGEEGEDWERISIVFYFRTKMLDCLSPSEELDRVKHAKSFDLSKIESEYDYR